jgi:hypothetical protein
MQDTQELTLPDTDRWKNRRKMAWLSMLGGLFFPLLILATESATLGQIALPFYGFVGAVVAAYIGFATYDDIHIKPANKPQ